MNTADLTALQLSLALAAATVGVLGLVMLSVSLLHAASDSDARDSAPRVRMVCFVICEAPEL